MRKNVASQNVAGQMNARADGAPLTSSVSVYVTIDGGTQSAGGGTLTHKGNGHWNYVPTQAETNGNHIAFTFVHASGVNQTVNVYTVSFDPHNTSSLGLTNLDATVSSRLATGGYTAPDNATIAAIAGYTDSIESRLPAALVGGRMDVSVGAMAADVITAAAIAAGAITSSEAPALANLDVAVSTRLAAGSYTAPDNATITAIQADTNDIQTRLPAALVGGRIDASVGAMAADVLTAAALATSAVDELVDQVWNEAIAGHLTGGSTGERLNAAGSAGDPWATALPGSYGAGTAGYIVGNPSSGGGLTLPQFLALK